LLGGDVRALETDLRRLRQLRAARLPDASFAAPAALARAARRHPTRLQLASWRSAC
jgi:hypothetical protein